MFTIKAVSSATGVSIEALRAWERRYRVVEPSRDPNGRRSYDPKDVIRLRKLREATDRGHAISKLARFTDADLDRLLAEAARDPQPQGGAVGFAQRMLSAAERYRPDECDQALSMAFALLPLSEVVANVLAPVLVEVGERWFAGTFNVAQERLVTTSVRRAVGGVIDTYNRITSGRPLVLATLEDEPHELGILMCALLAAAGGVHCHYLGPCVPARDLAVFCEKVGARALILSMALRDTRATPAEGIATLLEFLPRDIELWVGGTAARELAEDGTRGRLRVMADFAMFEREVAAVAAAAR